MRASPAVQGFWAARRLALEGATVGGAFELQMPSIGEICTHGIQKGGLHLRPTGVHGYDVPPDSTLLELCTAAWKPFGHRPMNDILLLFGEGM